MREQRDWLCCKDVTLVRDWEIRVKDWEPAQREQEMLSADGRGNAAEDMEPGLTGPVGGIAVRRRDEETVILRNCFTTCL